MRRETFIVRAPVVCLVLSAAIVVMTVPAGCGRGSGDAAAPTASTSPERGATTVAGVLPSASTTIPTLPSETTTTTGLSPAETILQDMTLQEKAAQVLLLGFEGTTLAPSTQELLEAGPPGGLLLLGFNVEGAEQLRALTAALQEAAAATGSAVGLLVAVDQEGGAVQRVRDGVPIIPSARSLGEGHSIAGAAQLAAETAAGLLSLGVNMDLAPVADVVDDPSSFLYTRTYGGDPATVSDFVGAVTKAFVMNGLIAVPKHFPGHGSATGNTHGGTVLSEAPATAFERLHLPPFRAAFAAGADCVMVAHIVVSAYDPNNPASLSPAVVTGLLREQLDFSGVVVSDDLEMAAVSGSGSTTEGGLGDAAISALQAGCDLLIATGSSTAHKEMIDAITEGVQTGTLSEECLDAAVLHVLELKLRHGIVAR